MTTDEGIRNGSRRRKSLLLAASSVHVVKVEVDLSRPSLDEDKLKQLQVAGKPLRNDVINCLYYKRPQISQINYIIIITLDRRHRYAERGERVFIFFSSWKFFLYRCVALRQQKVARVNAEGVTNTKEVSEGGVALFWGAAVPIKAPLSKELGPCLACPVADGE